MIRYVVDASSVAPLIVPDEAENLFPFLLSALEGGECTVPGLWHYEVGNLALMAARRGRAEIEDIRANLQELLRFPIALDGLSAQLAWSQSLALAGEYGLTLYDASYLELAQRSSLTLLTMDGDLIKAASRAGVRINGQA